MDLSDDDDDNDSFDDEIRTQMMQRGEGHSVEGAKSGLARQSSLDNDEEDKGFFAEARAHSRALHKRVSCSHWAT